MTFVPVLNTVEIGMQFLQGGQETANVYHVNHNTSVTVEAMTDDCATFAGWWVDNVLGSVHSSVELVRVTARDLTTQDSLVVDYTDGLPVLGSNSSPALPNNVTVAVKWSTGFAGRSYRGRTYHIGLTEAQVLESRLTIEFQAGLTDVYAALLTAVNDSTRVLCVVSRQHNKVVRTEGVATIITGLSIDPVIDSQRRRLPGRGR